ncbi:MAG: vWA domain-containing protein [Burkholderiales bacterium]
MNAPEQSSRLAANVVHFARLLRRAGLPVGVDKTLAAVEAAAWVGPERRADLHAALAATLIDRAEQRELFDEAFRLFWQPRPATNAAARLPRVAGPLARGEAEQRMSNRLADALRSAHASQQPPRGEEITLDAALTSSQREVLRERDFESMSTDEARCAQRVLRELDLPLPLRTSRRYRPHTSGAALDLRATLRHNLKHGGEWIVRRRRIRRSQPRDLVVLCDISGSMARYARMLLHFLHGLGSLRRGMHTFVFGTRLTNVSRALRSRDVDQALAAVGRAVPDWSGGTRIGACLREFNQRWSRRVLSRGGVVLLISDGLDAGEGNDLDAQMRRLRASCASLLWLNPLLRFHGFEPRAAGILSILPYVDCFLPAHNLASLADLGRVFRTLPGARTRPIS